MELDLWLLCPLLHRVNFVVVTPTLYVMDKVIWAWDFSGSDALDEWKGKLKQAKKGTKSHRHGSDGNHGHHGQSGGNVMILADKIVNPTGLTIVSNGGNGANGQVRFGSFFQ